MLIGDTPAEAEGAQPHGVRVLAIASGKSSEAALQAAGADAALPDWRDWRVVAELVRRGIG
ncbi:hypothetical protein [Streptomyces melanogenes]|uniref:hypothetical protein n=1 Tax=Streptomyces melanogenes TaxID=67326 RepID=UPI0037AA40F7